MNIPFRLLLACCLMTSANAAKAHDLSFANAWIDLQKSNHALAAERLEIDAKQKMSRARKRLYLPNVSLSATYVHLEEDIKTPLLVSNNPQAAGMLASIQMPEYLAKRDITQAHLRATMPLFAGGRIINAQKLSRAELTEAQAHVELKRQQLFEDLTARYFGVDLAKAVLKTQQLASDALAQHLAHAKLLETQGQIAKVETLQAQTAFDNAQIERDKALQDLEIAKLALAYMSNSDERDLNLVDELFISQKLPALDELLSASRERHPAFKILAAKREQANIAAKISRASRLPSVMALADYHLHSKGIERSDDNPDWLIGITMSVPLFDRSAGSLQAEAREATAAKVAALLQQTDLDIELLLRKTHQQARQAQQEFNSLNSSIELGKTALDMRQKAFSQGLSSSLDVVDAQLYLSSIQSKRLQAAYHYVVALARLLALSGNSAQFADYQFEYGVPVL